MINLPLWVQLQVPFWWVIGISRLKDKEGGSYDEETGKGDEVGGDSTFSVALSRHYQIKVLLLVFAFYENKYI